MLIMNIVYLIIYLFKRRAAGVEVGLAGHRKMCNINKRKLAMSRGISIRIYTCTYNFPIFAVCEWRRRRWCSQKVNAAAVSNLSVIIPYYFNFLILYSSFEQREKLNCILNINRIALFPSFIHSSSELGGLMAFHFRCSNQYPGLQEQP